MGRRGRPKTRPDKGNQSNHGGAGPSKMMHRKIPDNRGLKLEALDSRRQSQGKCKPSSCTICGKNFRTQTGLDWHKRSHTGEMPFSCPTCSKQFRHSAGFKYHMRSAHVPDQLKPYKCKFCENRYPDVTTLKSHTRQHTGEKPYQCLHCTERFPYHARIVVHIRTCHPGQDVKYVNTETGRQRGLATKIQELEQQSFTISHLKAKTIERNAADFVHEELVVKIQAEMVPGPFRYTCGVHSTDEEEEERGKGEGQPKIQEGKTSGHDKQSQSQNLGIVIKRTRGRPRKLPRLDDEQDQNLFPMPVEMPILTPLDEGQILMQPSQDSDLPVLQSEIKELEQALLTIVDATDSEAVPLIKRKRGRPRKYPIVEKAIPLIKRKRGRPRKSEGEPVNSEGAAEEFKPQANQEMEQGNDIGETSQDFMEDKLLQKQSTDADTDKEDDLSQDQNHESDYVVQEICVQVQASNEKKEADKIEESRAENFRLEEQPTPVPSAVQDFPSRKELEPESNQPEPHYQAEPEVETEELVERAAISEPDLATSKSDFQEIFDSVNNESQETEITGGEDVILDQKEGDERDPMTTNVHIQASDKKPNEIEQPSVDIFHKELLDIHSVAESSSCIELESNSTELEVEPVSKLVVSEIQTELLESEVETGEFVDTTEFQNIDRSISNDGTAEPEPEPTIEGHCAEDSACGLEADATVETEEEVASGMEQDQEQTQGQESQIPTNEIEKEEVAAENSMETPNSVPTPPAPIVIDDFRFQETPSGTIPDTGNTDQEEGGQFEPDKDSECGQEAESEVEIEEEQDHGQESQDRTFTLKPTNESEEEEEEGASENSLESLCSVATLDPNSKNEYEPQANPDDNIMMESQENESIDEILDQEEEFEPEEKAHSILDELSEPEMEFKILETWSLKDIEQPEQGSRSETVEFKSENEQMPDEDSSTLPELEKFGEAVTSGEPQTSSRKIARVAPIMNPTGNDNDKEEKGHCPHCGKKFKHAPHLREHIRIHTGEKPFICKICSRAFTAGSGLRSHLKIHAPGEDKKKRRNRLIGENPVHCPTCDQTFTSTTLMYKHLKSAHPDTTPFACDCCHKPFSTFSLLYRHRMRSNRCQGRDTTTSSLDFDSE